MTINDSICDMSLFSRLIDRLIELTEHRKLFWAHDSADWYTTSNKSLPISFSEFDTRTNCVGFGSYKIVVKVKSNGTNYLLEIKESHPVFAQTKHLVMLIKKSRTECDFAVQSIIDTLNNL